MFLNSDVFRTQSHISDEAFVQKLMITKNHFQMGRIIKEGQKQRIDVYTRLLEPYKRKYIIK